MLFRTPRTSVRFRMPVLLALVLLFGASCSGKSGQIGAIDKPNPKLPTTTIRVGNISLEVEIASTEEQRNRGMMFRKSLEGEGHAFRLRKRSKDGFLDEKHFHPAFPCLFRLRRYYISDNRPCALFRGSPAFPAERPLRCGSAPGLVRQGGDRDGRQVRYSEI